MSLLNSTELATPAPAPEERGPGNPANARAPIEHRDRWNMSLLWRVFAANAAVFLAAFAVLAWSPITIHAHIRLAELVLLLAGLLVMLACDLLLLRRALRPLRTLAAVMSAVDPMRPGRRAALAHRAGSEVLALARRATECSTGSRPSGAKAHAGRWRLRRPSGCA
jgi:two-component system, NarL family, sensor histidine kinase UhpB